MSMWDNALSGLKQQIFLAEWEIRKQEGVRDNASEKLRTLTNSLESGNVTWEALQIIEELEKDNAK